MSRPDPVAPRRWRVGRGLGAVVAVTVAVTGVALASAGRPHPAAAAPGVGADPSAAALHAMCPNLIEAYPGSSEYPASAGFYGLPTGLTISAGTLAIGPVARTTNISATACGYFILPTLNARFTATSVTTRGAADECPGCSITFHPGAVTLAGLVTLPTQLVSAGPTTSTVSPTPGPNGGLQLTVSAPTDAVIRVAQVGVACTIGPIDVSLTTAISGSLTGSALAGPLTGAQGVVVGQRFSVPGAVPSTDCPPDLIPPTDALAGLPAPPGGASVVAQIHTINSLNLP